MLPLLPLAPAHVAPAPVFRAEEPKIIGSSLTITTKRFLRYNPAGRKEPVYGQWSWVPQGEFNVRGPLEGGSQLVVNFTKPDGSPWLSLQCETPEVAAGEWGKVKLPDLDENKAALFSGTLGFQIVLKNDLTNTKKVLYTGKYVVKTFHSPFDKAPGATEFYVDHDWLLPVGYIATNTEFDADAPCIDIRLWLCGKTADIDTHIAAYIVYNGKTIASSKHKNDGGSTDQITLGQDKIVTTPGMQAGDPAWYRLVLNCANVRVSNADKTGDGDNQWHILAKHPGEYEVKITRDGKPIRAAKFTVGTNGKLVPSGLESALSTAWLVLPIKIEPGSEPKANLTAYKTGAFYGNPLPGFVAP